MVLSTSCFDSALNQVHHTLGIDDVSGNAYSNGVPPAVMAPASENPPSTLSETPGKKPGLPDSIRNIKEIAREAIDAFKKSWNRYCKRVLKFTKILLKSTELFSGDETVTKIKTCIAYLGLASLVNLGIEIDDLINDTKDLIDDIKLHDAEGITWSTANILNDLLGIVDTLISLGETMDKFVSIPFISLFSIVTTPLSLALLTYETIHSIYKLVMSSIEYHRLPKKIEDEEGLEKFKEYLEAKVGITEKERKAIELSVYNKYGILNFAAEKNGGYNIVVLNVEGIRGRTVLFERDSSPISLFGTEGSDGNNGKAVKKANKKIQAANKEIARKVEVLKTRKINKLSRDVDKRIAKYTLNTRLHLRMIEIYDLHTPKRNSTSLTGSRLSQFFNFLDEKANDMTLSAEEKKECAKARDAILEYLELIEHGKMEPSNSLMMRYSSEEFRRIKKDFYSFSSIADQWIEEYMIQRKRSILEPPRTNAAQRVFERVLISGERSVSTGGKEVVITSLRPLATRRIECLSREQLATVDTGSQEFSDKKKWTTADQIRIFANGIEMAQSASNDLNKLSIRKLILTSLKTFTCFLEWAMEILTLILSPLATTITKLGFASFKLGISVFKEIYEIQWMDRGLKNPNFLPLKV